MAMGVHSAMENNNAIDLVDRVLLDKARKIATDLNEWNEFLKAFIRAASDKEDTARGIILKYSMTIPEKTGNKKMDALSIPENFVGEKNLNNLLKIVKLIKKNSWEKGTWNNENIYADDFKEICKTTFKIPCKNSGMYGNIFSGVYVLHLLHSADFSDKSEIELMWRSDLYDDDKGGNDYRRKYKKFFSPPSSYLKQFEEKLQISLKQFNLSEEKKDTILWSLFETYYYAFKNLGSKKKAKNKILQLFDTPYLCLFGEQFIFDNTGDFDIADEYKGMIFFKTVLFQNLDENCRRRAVKLYDSLEFSSVVVQLAILGAFYRLNQIFGSDKLLIEKENLISQIQNDIDKCLQSMPVAEKSSSDKVEKISVTEENVCEIILDRINWLEFKALREIIKNTFIVFPKFYNTYEQVTLYSQTDFNEVVGVSNWTEFKEKYHYHLKVFFPDTNIDALKKYWNIAIKLLSDSTFNISKQKDSTQSERIDTMRTKFVFSTMFLIANSLNYDVKMRGKNTKFYRGLKNPNSEPVESGGQTLYDVLRKMETQYNSEQSPHFKVILFLQFLWWLFEQNFSFKVKEKMIVSIGEFIFKFLDECEIIMRVNDFDNSTESAMSLKKWADELASNLLSKWFL